MRVEEHRTFCMFTIDEYHGTYELTMDEYHRTCYCETPWNTAHALHMHVHGCHDAVHGVAGL